MPCDPLFDAYYDRFAPFAQDPSRVVGRLFGVTVYSFAIFLSCSAASVRAGGVNGVAP